ncbi:N-acetyltransferase domain-containing protein [Mycena venus]|uniref:N-acetyltransferase domain-containing protein n=1 Tax=Mycena venus TaxID=2733690 RepID=A0A8H6Y798_9AGAR|nr:N-acetyltransferase domain-containing protein [Mycena venus]
MASNDIYIRPYRPSDFPQVRDLFFEGFLTGRGSVATAATRQFLLKAPMIAGYFLSICGGTLLYYLPHWDNIAGILGVLLFASGFAIYLIIGRAVNKGMKAFLENVLEADMRDISAYYATPAAFFVATRPVESDKKNEDAEKTEQVVGFVGLEYQPEKKTHTAEVRRMVVAPKYRRRGIAKRLVNILIEHAESVRGLDSIELGTNEFQPAARKLFEGLGWEFKGTDLEWAGFFIVRRLSG